MASSFIALLCFPNLHMRGVSDVRTALEVLIALATTYAIYNVSMQAWFKTYSAILDSDLVLTSALSLGDASSSPPGMQQWENAQDNPVTNTILKTILTPEFVPVNRVCTSVASSDSNSRFHPDFSSSVMASYGFERQRWMTDAPSTRLLWNGSAEYVLGDLPTSGVTLPYDISTAAGLLIAGTHVAPFLYDPNGGVGYKHMSSSLRTFVNTARQWSAMPKGALTEAYLKASRVFLLDLNSTIALPHADLPGMKVNYSRIRIDESTYADALTFDIPYDDAVSTRKMEFGWNATTNSSTVTCSPNPGSNTYELLASSDCGLTTCASQLLDFFTPEHQVQVLQVCVDRETSMETFGLAGLDKEYKSAYSFFLVGIGSRIESDRKITLGPVPGPSTLGFPTRIRFQQRPEDVCDQLFQASCKAASCLGYFEYVEALDQYLLLGAAHFPLLQAARFRNQAVEWKPLATTLNPSSGNREIFAEARISTSGTWAKSKSDKPICSSEVEKLVVRQTTNHLYSGHPLQATFMSGYFFLLQFATLRSSIIIFDTSQSTEEVDLTDAYHLGTGFDGNADFYSYGLQVSEIAGLVSCLTMLCAFLILLHIVTRGPTKNKKQAVRRLNLTQCVKAMLVDEKYPSIFLTCRVILCGNNKSVETHDIRKYAVVAATLKHNKTKGAPISLQLEDSATTKKPASVQSVEKVPEPNVNPVELAQVKTTLNPLE